MKETRISGILKTECREGRVIRLFRQGMFLCAYDWSAVRLRNKTGGVLKIVRITRKDGTSYLKAGMPVTSKLVDFSPFKDTNGNIPVELIIEGDEPVEVCLEDVAVDKTVCYQTKEKKREDEKEKRVLDELRNVNLADITPMQAMKLVGDWQRLLGKEGER